MKNKDEIINRFVIECDCGCSELVFDQWKDDGLSFISLMIPAWSSKNYNNFKNTCKIIWSILRGKQYCFFEIVIDDNEQLTRFKEFVANMKEITT